MKEYREGPQAAQAKADADRAAATRQSTTRAARRPPGSTSLAVRQLWVLFLRRALLLARAPVANAETGRGMVTGALVVAMPLLIGVLEAGSPTRSRSPTRSATGPQPHRRP